jgi:hypothetical protein
MSPTIRRLSILIIGMLIGPFAQAETTNVPPTKAFSAYGSIELKRIVLDKADAGDKGRVAVIEKIQTYFDEQVAPIVTSWDKKPHSEGEVRLVIEPRVDTIRKVGGATRFFAGALAGDSHVTMHVRFVEQPGDVVIAEPEFYQRAAAMSGAWTVGAQDNDMLRRITKLVVEYLNANYEKPSGGRTGRTE